MATMTGSVHYAFDPDSDYVTASKKNKAIGEIMMNLSILDNDGTLGDLYCGNDGQFPCPDDPLPILHHGLNWNNVRPPGTGRLTFVPVGAGASGNYNDTQLQDPVAASPVAPAPSAPQPPSKPISTNTMLLLGGGLLLVLLLKK